ncbi:ribosome biogenesis GTP-binding protein YihA/YsxC [Anaeromyxobacter sp. PSR-1]|uniref:ribosome biogenesis GTP-binding protein YihA/YsxC n=1 Tax=unclassified Anaeromyxobacter TaxID=2620896 RepID=UPI0005E5B2C0|nr:ribosome biogenesis GTP-binding protein YihA/YsxC [Anaeromyxobacter sp. PSR-1]GAO01898.1 putative GTP-binding protein EngB [Anaeromyxobacter sp. PSR-1]
MPIQVVSADFDKTATRPEEWPRGATPEIAFVGRSNVGKSSMLNALARRKGLARVSSTPGRTRALQFFDLSYRPTPKARPRPIRFCDLPGYGYAKVSRAERDRWTAMIEDYLRDRDVLRAVVLIVDARHPPSESDEDAAAFLVSAGRRLVVAATKMDKLPKARRVLALQQVERALGLARGDAVPFSAVEGTGTDALWARLAALAAEEARTAEAEPPA